MTRVAVRLMRDLRSAGWQHSVESDHRGRAHQWRRESAQIELVPAYDDGYDPYVSWCPRADEGWDLDDITATYRWLEPDRLPALRDVAVALGILTPLPDEAPVLPPHSDMCEDNHPTAPHLMGASRGCMCVCPRCSDQVTGGCICVVCEHVDHPMTAQVTR